MNRQGDVLLIPIAEIPRTASKVKRDKGRVVLAYGEVTGHAHAILDGGAELLQDAESQIRFLRVVSGLVRVTPKAIVASVLPGLFDVDDENGTEYRLTAAQVETMEVGKTTLLQGVTLHHEEHRAQVIAPGNHQLPTQHEYVAPEIVRRVVD